MVNGTNKKSVKKDNKAEKVISDTENNIEAAYITPLEAIDISNIQDEFFKNNSYSKEHLTQTLQKPLQQILINQDQYQDQDQDQDQDQNKKSGLGKDISNLQTYSKQKQNHNHNYNKYQKQEYNVTETKQQNLESNRLRIKKSVLDFNRTDFINKHYELSQALSTEDLLKLALARAEKEKNPIIVNAMKQILREINGEQTVSKFRKNKNNFNNRSQVPQSNFGRNNFEDNTRHINNKVANTNPTWRTTNNIENQTKCASSRTWNDQKDTRNIKSDSEFTLGLSQRTIQQRMDNYDAIYAEHMKTRETRTQRHKPVNKMT